jgi:C4-dicarboxylate-specific signal transduction histidine kinase
MLSAWNGSRTCARSPRHAQPADCGAWPSELALRGLSSDDPVREDVAHCVVVTAAVFDLVDQLDGSDRSPTLIAVHLDRSVNAMRRLLDALLPPSIEMHLEPDSDGAYVPISKLRIERIVLNLVLNARDAMDGGDGRVSITTRQNDDGIAQVIVADTGPGFSEDALAHLFEVGFTTKRDRGGSGQGLSALAAFVGGVGGTIEVDSKTGEGATITVSLPVADRQPAAVPWPRPHLRRTGRIAGPQQRRSSRRREGSWPIRS